MAMATACLSLAAVPLGLAPPPPRRAPTATGVRYGETDRPSRTESQWAKVEDKYAVTAIGVAALVGLWTAIGAIKAIDRLPLLPGVLELVGIGYTGWFTYRNLIFQPDREALVSKIKSTYKEITGSSS
uniref:Cyanobacterial aminoacyl-tRNA synthetase CAAD domain-containing protein n=1 Tax=Oryza brachyantha TaxID=4533 RepID=J3MKQ5_ORYBR